MTDTTDTTAVQLDQQELPAADVQLLTAAMAKIAQARAASGLPAWAVLLCDAIDLVAAYQIERDKPSMST